MITDIQKAFESIEQSTIETFFEDGLSQELLEKGELALNLTFPPSYAYFLKNYGVGGVEGFGVYGIIASKFMKKGQPNAIRLTLDARENDNLPNHLILIAEGGFGDYYALDCQNLNEDHEGPVVIWNPMYSALEQTYETVATSFAAFFRQEVEVAISLHEED